MVPSTLWLASLGSLISLSQAFIAFSPILTCQRPVIQGNEQRVCATYDVFGPSPAAFPNGTMVLLGPTGYNFEFWKGLAAGTDTVTLTPKQLEKHKLGYDINVQWENGACQVEVAGTECSSCSICAEAAGNPAQTTLSADCRNIEGGRRVKCEEALIFFPLKESRRFNYGIGRKSKKGAMKRREQS